MAIRGRFPEPEKEQSQITLWFNTFYKPSRYDCTTEGKAEIEMDVLY